MTTAVGFAITAAQPLALCCGGLRRTGMKPFLNVIREFSDARQQLAANRLDKLT